MSAPNSTITTSFWLPPSYGPNLGGASNTNSPVAASIIAVNNHLTTFSLACVWESQPADPNCDFLRSYVTLTFNPTSLTSSVGPGTSPTITSPNAAASKPTASPAPTTPPSTGDSESTSNYDITETINCSASGTGKPYVCTTSLNGAGALYNYCIWHTLSPSSLCKMDYSNGQITGSLPESLKVATVTYPASEAYYQTVFITGGFDKMTEQTGTPKKSAATACRSGGPSRGLLLGLSLGVSLVGLLQAGL